MKAKDLSVAIKSQKGMILFTVIASLIVFSPFILKKALAHTTRGYFYGYICTCGMQNFVYFRDDGYYTYSPGHGHNSRQYTIRPHDTEWEALNDAGQVAFRFRIQDGDLWEGSPFSATWTRHARVYNYWDILKLQLFARHDG
jgi:hypothetical protein